MTNLKLMPAKVRLLSTSKVKLPPKQKAAPYYDPRWIELRARIVRERGSRCEDPEHDATKPRRGRVICDHVIELCDGGSLLDPRNILLRCPSCHGLKSMRERAKRRDSL
jgi:5-methylcytosine-specific restriction protein A